MITIPRFRSNVKAKTGNETGFKKDLILTPFKRPPFASGREFGRSCLHLIPHPCPNQIQHALAYRPARDSRERLRVQLQLRPMALDRPGRVRVGLIIHQHPRAALDKAAVDHALQKLRVKSVGLFRHVQYGLCQND